MLRWPSGKASAWKAEGIWKDGEVQLLRAALRKLHCIIRQCRFLFGGFSRAGTLCRDKNDGIQHFSGGTQDIAGITE